ncbi:hypothetical protein BLNAU_4418 [Blattamonas nauphoetae]|uniref:Uncharacterized protein n=1 Tax=Blattamonas nauphoetae TaxID=2049346 RepID=A0ABQ9Y9U5_9EUKA|nr:hypothetical protein BLNAU_4418 [Blattamonas nauphoetae]
MNPQTPTRIPRIAPTVPKKNASSVKKQDGAVKIANPALANFLFDSSPQQISSRPTSRSKRENSTLPPLNEPIHVNQPKQPKSYASIHKASQRADSTGSRRSSSVGPHYTSTNPSSHMNSIPMSPVNHSPQHHPQNQNFLESPNSARYSIPSQRNIPHSPIAQSQSRHALRPIDEFVPSSMKQAPIQGRIENGVVIRVHSAGHRLQQSDDLNDDLYADERILEQEMQDTHDFMDTQTYQEAMSELNSSQVRVNKDLPQQKNDSVAETIEDYLEAIRQSEAQTSSELSNKHSHISHDSSQSTSPPTASTPEQQNPQAQKTPKSINYKPYTLQDYKDIKGQPAKRGGLGPDLDNEELKKKRAEKERQQEYAKKQRELNREKMAKEKEREQKRKEKDLSSSPAGNGSESRPNSGKKNVDYLTQMKRPSSKQTSAHERAKEFASRIPKPKIAPKKKESEESSEKDNQQDTSTPGGGPKKSPKTPQKSSSKPAFDDPELAALEAQIARMADRHAQDEQNLENVMNSRSPQIYGGVQQKHSSNSDSFGSMDRHQSYNDQEALHGHSDRFTDGGQRRREAGQKRERTNEEVLRDMMIAEEFEKMMRKNAFE